MSPSSEPQNTALHALIDRYFEGRAQGADAARMFEALKDNPTAKVYFERRQLFAQTDPKGNDAKARIAANLGFQVPQSAEQRERARIASWIPRLSVAGVFAAVLLVFVVPTADEGTDRKDDGFSSRGVGKIEIEVESQVIGYRILKGSEGSPAHSSKLEGSIDAESELAFAYVNPKGRRHLMVWGVDERGDVFWFHPAWTDPNDNPAAVSVEKGAALKELPAAISHDLRGQQLTLFALFTDERPTVREVEATLTKSAAPDGELLNLGTLEVRKSP